MVWVPLALALNRGTAGRSGMSRLRRRDAKGKGLRSYFRHGNVLRLKNWVLQNWTLSLVNWPQYTSVIGWQKSNKFMSHPVCWSMIIEAEVRYKQGVDASFWFCDCYFYRSLSHLCKRCCSSPCLCPWMNAIIKDFLCIG